MTPHIWQKWRGTVELLDECERREWKSWLNTQHSKNQDHGIRSHHFMANRWKQWQANFLGSKITADGDWGLKIKRLLPRGRKAMTNLDSILKSRDITLLTKVHIVKSMVFPVVMYGCESWTTKKAEHWRIDAFELWCWRRLLRVPWTARRSNQSIPKGNKSWIFIGRTDNGRWSSNILATWCEEVTYEKRPWCWQRLKAGGERDDRRWDGWMASLTQWTWI